MKRQTNEAVHRLVKATTSLISFQVLVNIPNYIEYILSNEAIFLQIYLGIWVAYIYTYEILPKKLKQYTHKKV